MRIFSFDFAQEPNHQNWGDYLCPKHQQRSIEAVVVVVRVDVDAVEDDVDGDEGSIGHPLSLWLS